MTSNQYTLQHTVGDIYSVSFTDPEDLWKTFIRYQEYYESPKFHGQIFTLDEYKKWYSKKFGGGKFTYGKDWVGFNIPSSVIKEVVDGAIDLNKYDNLMQDIASTIGKDVFYLIGVKFPEKDLNHEIAHGLYYIDKEYRECANKLVEEIPEEKFHLIRNKLLAVGYCDHVIIDEVQAYMATGTKGVCRMPSFFCFPFENLYATTMLRLKEQK